MQTRTRLTTPPGQEPVVEPTVSREDPERYSPGLAIPTEPRVPGPNRRRIVALVVVAVLALAGYVGMRVMTAGQFQDPALSDEPADGTDPALELPGEDPAGG